RSRRDETLGLGGKRIVAERNPQEELPLPVRGCPKGRPRRLSRKAGFDHGARDGLALVIEHLACQRRTSEQGQIAHLAYVARDKQQGLVAKGELARNKDLDARAAWRKPGEVESPGLVGRTGTNTTRTKQASNRQLGRLRRQREGAWNHHQIVVAADEGNRGHLHPDHGSPALIENPTKGTRRARHAQVERFLLPRAERRLGGGP